MWGRVLGLGPMSTAGEYPGSVSVNDEHSGRVPGLGPMSTAGEYPGSGSVNDEHSGRVPGLGPGRRYERERPAWGAGLPMWVRVARLYQ